LYGLSLNGVRGKPGRQTHECQRGERTTSRRVPKARLARQRPVAEAAVAARPHCGLVLHRALERITATRPGLAEFLVVEARVVQ